MTRSGQTVAGLASLGAAFLAGTGLALTCRRFVRWARKNLAPGEG